MKKILAIDDNKINIELLANIIRKNYRDYLFIGCSNGAYGISLAKKELPEVILLDILMPELNGYEVCRILKDDEKTKNIPILIISALGNDTNERTKGLNAGADAFINKPFSQNEVKAQIDVALRIKRVEDLLRKRNESLELFIKDQTKKYLQNEEKFNQISEHAREFYWETDQTGLFTYMSPVVVKTLDINAGEIVGKKNYIELFQLNQDSKKSKIEISFNESKNFKDCEIEIIASNQNETIWLSVSGLAVFNRSGEFYGMRGVCYDVTKYKNIEIALKNNVTKINNYQIKLKNLNREITLIEERERRRIAENLHDSLGQTLSLAFIKLSSIIDSNFSPHERGIIHEAYNLIDQAVAESRELTYDLCPPILYELGLIPALQWKMEQIEEKHGLNVFLKSNNVLIDIVKENNIFMYRIICELFTNVVKHARASSIYVEICKYPESYVFTVKDDGIGFDIDQIKSDENPSSSFGLLSISERLDNMNGKLRIESEIGKGTKTTIEIPIIENKPHENQSINS